MRRGVVFCSALCLALGIGGAPVYASDVPDEDAFVETMIAVAVEELGYTEGDGGYTKYTEWSGDNKYSEWCSNFVSWCADQADQRLGTRFLEELYPMQEACVTGVRWFTDHGRYISAAGTLKGLGAQWYREDGVLLADRPYIPRAGDLVYFEWYEYNRIDHVGIIERVDQDEDGVVTIHTIEGNGFETDFVKRFTYALDDPSIRAYGILRDEVGTDLSPGAEGALVEDLQRRLIEGGWADFDVDGFYGAKTTDAIKRLQEAFGLEPTGIADRLTQDALDVRFEG